MRTRLGLTALGAWLIAMVAVISYTVLVDRVGPIEWTGPKITTTTTIDRPTTTTIAAITDVDRAARHRAARRPGRDGHDDATQADPGREVRLPEVHQPGAGAGRAGRARCRREPPAPSDPAATHDDHDPGADHHDPAADHDHDGATHHHHAASDDNHDGATHHHDAAADDHHHGTTDDHHDGGAHDHHDGRSADRYPASDHPLTL